MSFDARVDATPEVVQGETPQVLTVSQLLSDLKSGIDRTEIRKKYNLTQAEAKAIFSHPKLQGIRVKKQKAMRVQLIDDTEAPTDPNQMSITDSLDPVGDTIKANELRDDANQQLVEALDFPTQPRHEPFFTAPSSIQLSESLTFSHQTETNDNQNEIQD
jgi:hypothetical protein|tara:strand:+ start:43 stop:522 length:480 start_codon:yes stop_codon:yes gene_type:complete